MRRSLDLETSDAPADPRVEKLGSTALRERAYAELGEAIRAGRFDPGEQVTIRGLAEMLGTSTMPVREAVSRLVIERALEVLPNGRMRVPVLTLERLDELTEARVTLEGRMAELACERMTPNRFCMIRAANERYVSAIEDGNSRLAVAANEAMHFELYSAAGSPLILSLIEGLWLQSGPYIAAMMKSMSDNEPATMPEKGSVHHFQLLAALSRGDGEAARAALVDDIRDAADWYRQAIFSSSTTLDT
jgi:DNA-binding GntR family transcriptional regulator